MKHEQLTPVQSVHCLNEWHYASHGTSTSHRIPQEGGSGPTISHGEERPNRIRPVVITIHIITRILRRSRLDQKSYFIVHPHCIKKKSDIDSPRPLSIEIITNTRRPVDQAYETYTGRFHMPSNSRIYGERHRQLNFNPIVNQFLTYRLPPCRMLSWHHTSMLVLFLIPRFVKGKLNDAYRHVKCTNYTLGTSSM